MCNASADDTVHFSGGIGGTRMATVRRDGPKLLLELWVFHYRRLCLLPPRVAPPAIGPFASYDHIPARSVVSCLQIHKHTNTATNSINDDDGDNDWNGQHCGRPAIWGEFFCSLGHFPMEPNTVYFYCISDAQWAGRKWKCGVSQTIEPIKGR